MKIRLEIDGMTCQHCQEHVRRALTSVVGVESAVVDLGSASAEIEGGADTASLIAAVRAAGYEAEPAR